MLSEILIAVIIVLFLIVWVVTVAIAFVGGLLYKGRKKPPAEPKKPTEAEIRKAKRMQKEVENFMTYDGTEQEAID